MKVLPIISIACSMIIFACQNTGEKNLIKRQAPSQLDYQLISTQNWLDVYDKNSNTYKIITSVNRTDSIHLLKMDSIIVPMDSKGDIEFYLHFPLYVKYLQNINKIIYFSYATQTFGAYEKGNLIYSGACNMGKKSSLTPTGLFFTNWKSIKTISSFNDEWELYWNFNISNKEGIGWHLYALPGYPASSSCLRLQDDDARFLYNWADQWVLSNESSILIKGTPVIIFGKYKFEQPKPWLALVNNPEVFDISEKSIKKETIKFYNLIVFEQNQREDYLDSIKHTDTFQLKRGNSVK
jgi:hypothetical protein